MTKTKTTKTHKRTAPAPAAPADTQSRLIPLEPLRRYFGGRSWEQNRSRLNATWPVVYDEKRRRVHGYAVIIETPAEIVGRKLTEGSMTWTVSQFRFSVSVICTRDGFGFGATPRSSGHNTLDEALAYAVHALDEQGRRYRKKYPGLQL